MIGLMLNEETQINDTITWEGGKYRVVKMGNVRKPKEKLKLVYVEKIMYIERKVLNYFKERTKGKY